MSALHALQAIATVLALGGALIIVWGLICQWAEATLRAWADIRALDEQQAQEREGDCNEREL